MILFICLSVCVLAFIIKGLIAVIIKSNGFKISHLTKKEKEIIYDTLEDMLENLEPSYDGEDIITKQGYWTIFDKEELEALKSAASKLKYDNEVY